MSMHHHKASKTGGWMDGRYLQTGNLAQTLATESTLLKASKASECIQQPFLFQIQYMTGMYSQGGG